MARVYFDVNLPKIIIIIRHFLIDVHLFKDIYTLNKRQIRWQKNNNEGNFKNNF